jgi:hypothetical protein
MGAARRYLQTPAFLVVADHHRSLAERVATPPATDHGQHAMTAVIGALDDACADEDRTIAAATEVLRMATQYREGQESKEADPLGAMASEVCSAIGARLVETYPPKPPVPRRRSRPPKRPNQFWEWDNGWVLRREHKVAGILSGADRERAYELARAIVSMWCHRIEDEFPVLVQEA